jgi:hypothetical protein
MEQCSHCSYWVKQENWLAKSPTIKGKEFDKMFDTILKKYKECPTHGINNKMATYYHYEMTQKRKRDMINAILEKYYFHIEESKLGEWLEFLDNLKLDLLHHTSDKQLKFIYDTFVLNVC